MEITSNLDMLAFFCTRRYQRRLSSVGGMKDFKEISNIYMGIAEREHRKGSYSA